MRKLILAATSLLALAGIVPVFAQGATHSPPSPNGANSAPTPLDSVPPGARTTPTGRGVIAGRGSIRTTYYTKAAHHRRLGARPEVNPDAPEGQTVPVPQSQ